MLFCRFCRLRGAGYVALLFCLCVVAAFVCGAPRPTRAQQPPAAAAAAAPRASVSGRTVWDENYLYLVVQVDDAGVQGTNSAPLSQPQQDDSVGVYLQVGPGRPQTSDANTHALIVSAAGGFTFLSGTGAGGALAPRSLRDLLGSGRAVKVGVTVQGTLNRSDDRDQGYTVEMAIPWDLLGAKPGASVALGCDIVARSRGQQRATSLAANGDTVAEADVVRPSRFATLTLQGTGQVAPPAPFVAPQVAPERAPRVNGVLATGEWTERGRFAFAAPDQTIPSGAPSVGVVPPVVAAAATVPRIALDASLAQTGKRVFARYVLGFQGDSRKPAAFRGVRASRTSGRFLLSDQPAGGAGPWFSSDRPGWHRQQLGDMRRLGVDAALVEIGGPDADAGRADEKSLLVLVSALRAMEQAGERAPQIAPYFDTSRLLPPGSARPSLSTQAGRDVLYRAVRRWMTLVPADLRAQVPLPLTSGGARAYPIFLSSAAAFTDLGEAGSEWVSDLRTRFARDFGPAENNATLLVVGGADFAQTTPLPAYLPAGSAGGKGTGPLATYVVQPGYDDSGRVLGSGNNSVKPTLRGRRDGAAYREAWEAALAADARWIIVDSWNDFGRGTEVAASRQYGPRYLDLTRIGALQFDGLASLGVKWLSHNVPATMRPLEVSQVDVRLQNTGITPLRGDAGFALTYRWLQNNRLVAESLLRVRVPGVLLPTQTLRLPLGVAAARVTTPANAAPPASRGARAAVAVPTIDPLPAGNYVLQIEMVQIGGGGPGDTAPLRFSQNGGGAPLSVPVTIAANTPDAVQFESTTTPPLVQAGATYPVTVRLRWQGRETLPAGSAALTYQLLTETGAQTGVTGTVSLVQSAAPGQTLNVRANVRFADASGSAIPAAFPEAAGNTTSSAPSAYRLRWLVTRTSATDSVAGAHEETVAVYPDDREAQFVVSPAKVPAQIEAGELADVPITVVNAGPTRWTKGDIRVGYHWFYGDGIEAVWRSPVTVAIDRDVEPGKAVSLTIPVRAPERDGEYVLAFDAVRSGSGDEWLSAQALSGASNDLGLARVRVTGGGLTYVDLGRAFNRDAVAGESAPTDGDMDGAGATLPAEDFPPDAFGLLAAAPAALESPTSKKPKNTPPTPAYPSGYYADISPTARRIGFRYGPKTPGAKNAIACEGQTITLPGGRYSGLHLVAAATTGTADRPLTLVLHYKNGTTETATRTVGALSRPATEREAIAIQTLRKRTPAGDVAQTCALRHLIVPASGAKNLVSVTLPNDPAISLFALTLER